MRRDRHPGRVDLGVQPVAGARPSTYIPYMSVPSSVPLPVPAGPRRPAVGLLALLALALAPLGCSGGDGGDAVVELGTGTISFEPLTAEQDLVLVAGPQGGHHFIVHARAQGISPGNPNLPGQTENPATWFEAYTEDGEQIDLMFPPYRLGFVQGDGGWYELPSGRILQVDEARVTALYGQRTRLLVRIRDKDGATGTAETWVRAVEDLNPPDGDGGVPDAGDGDGGVADAGVADAAAADAAAADAAN